LYRVKIQYVAKEKFADLPYFDRPREKLQRRGPASLSDFELLEVLIGSGSADTDVSQIAKGLQRVLQRSTGDLLLEDLKAIRGVSLARAARVLSALEIARRYLQKTAEPLKTAADLVARLDDIRGKKQEYLVALTLDGGQRLIAQRTVTIGTLDAVMAHPREVFADAITDRAASVVVAHNHASGSVEPSHNDISLTQQLAAAGQLLGVELRDHIIINKNDYFSFRQHHML